MEIASSSGIYKTLSHNSGYLLLFGMKKLQSYKISCELLLNLSQGPLLEGIRYVHTGNKFSGTSYE